MAKVDCIKDIVAELGGDVSVIQRISEYKMAVRSHLNRLKRKPSPSQCMSLMKSPSL